MVLKALYSRFWAFALLWPVVAIVQELLLHLFRMLGSCLVRCQQLPKFMVLMGWGWPCGLTPLFCPRGSQPYQCPTAIHCCLYQLSQVGYLACKGKGLALSKQSLSYWVVDTVSQAYPLKGLQTPPVKSSCRSVSTLWVPWMSRWLTCALLLPGPPAVTFGRFSESIWLVLIWWLQWSYQPLLSDAGPWWEGFPCDLAGITHPGISYHLWWSGGMKQNESYVCN